MNMWSWIINKRDRSVVIGLALILASLLIYTQASCAA